MANQNRPSGVDLDPKQLDLTMTSLPADQSRYRKSPSYDTGLEGSLQEGRQQAYSR
jgi:hypothetical protein